MEKKAKGKKCKVSETWTPERKAEFRKHLPEKLSKFGEWFFSNNTDKEYLIVNDWDAVMK